MWQLIGHWRLPDKYKLLHLDPHEDKIDALPGKFRRKTIPKIWYFMVNSGAVFFLPFLGIYWRKDCHFTTRQIGIIQALRPWVSAAAGYLLIPISDAWSIHYLMLLLTYALTMISRGLITMDWSYGVMLVLVLIMEAAVSPMSILVDATVVAGSVKDGTYGRARLWASVGWGGFATVAGVILQRLGMHAVFMIFVIIYSLACIPTLLVPASLLAGAKRRLSIRSQQSRPSNDSQSSGAHSADEVSSTQNISGGTKTAVLHQEKTGDCTSDSMVVIASSRRRSSIATVGGEVNRRVSSMHHQQGGEPLKVVAATDVVDSRRRTTETYRPVIDLAVGTQSTQSIPEIIILGEACQVDESKQQQQNGADGISGTRKISIIENRSDFTDDSDEESTEDGTKLSSISPKSSNSEADGHDLPFNHLDLPGSPPESLWEGLWKLLCDVYVLTFFFKSLLMGIGNGFVGYLFLFLSDLGASGTLLGLCLTMNCISEVPVFYFSGIMIKKMGVQASLNLGMAAFVLRIGLYIVRR